MKDWLFYPFVLAITFGAIAFALSFIKSQENVVWSDGFIASGSELQNLMAAPGTSFTVQSSGVNPFAYAKLSAHTPRELAPPSAGAFTTITRPYLEALAGQRVKIIIRARKSEVNPVDKFEIGFFLSGSSVGWTSFELQDDFEDYGFETTLVKKFKDDVDIAYLGIWPDKEGKNRSVDIESFRMVPVSKLSKPDEESKPSEARPAPNPD